MIIIDQAKREGIERNWRIAELKTLLSESDYRMTKDYFEQMPLSDQDKWTSDRNSWRTELRSIENA